MGFFIRLITVDSWDKKALMSIPNRKLDQGSLANYRAKFKQFATSLPALTCYDLCVILAMIFNWAHHIYYHCHHHIITLTGYHLFPQGVVGGVCGVTEDRGLTLKTVQVEAGSSWSPDPFSHDMMELSSSATADDAGSS